MMHFMCFILLFSLIILLLKLYNIVCRVISGWESGRKYLEVLS